MFFKKAILKLFPGAVAIRNRILNYFAHYRFKNKTAAEVFSVIYRENHWRDNESKSGTGSNIKNTQQVVKILNDAIKKLSIQSILDIPCGDFNWMRNVSLDGIRYVGADIVDELIESNSQYSSAGIAFQKLNILESSIPAFDMVFCRDCLVHFSYKDIQRALDAMKASGSRYLMSTTFPSHTNYNIITGDWRPINLQAKPFNFPPPILMENEFTSEDERYADKSLAVWKIEDL
jgi:Methyltransferase domain